MSDFQRPLSARAREIPVGSLRHTRTPAKLGRGAGTGDAWRKKSPVPIYEGEESVIAWMLSGKNGSYGSYPALARRRPCRRHSGFLPKETFSAEIRHRRDRPPFKLTPAGCADLKRPARNHSSTTDAATGISSSARVRGDPTEVRSERQPRETRFGPQAYVHIASALHPRLLAPRQNLRAESRSIQDVIALWKKITRRGSGMTGGAIFVTHTDEKAFGGRGK